MWPNAVITGKSYEVSAEVIMLRDNEAQEAIEQFLIDDDISNAKKLLNIAVVDLDSKEYYDLTVAPTAWEITAESEDMITKSLTATGSGAPEKKTGFVVP
jgi:cytidylate kinase